MKPPVLAIRSDGGNGKIPPLIDILIRSGPFALFEIARAEYGYHELPDGYTGKCHLCVDVRRWLYQQGEFAELRPGGFYEEMG